MKQLYQWIFVGPAELSENPPWLQKKVVGSVVNSPKYNSTLLIVSYDGMKTLAAHNG
ncbi:uncharacterized protein P174DRAFT_440981 [Aspergillus novofumigatus IBT 16806]|uniref:Uncharacterized protein n=1 Tax=Aspergillus novofumigatus (strain IBT 16806) TaxID=1392255 RepID=A0A2I1C821_ASPN1|nr:uncharacterized protein P174DRAFT_440981 [Aspergillus novofumigatus IBT 16806]PKX93731.1 hypothetical protein P174DRAFT_440981 [Aspergillus novofumigatus IBT 16806]